MTKDQGSKNCRLLLYPDNLEHGCLLVKMLKPDFPYDYVGILHDQDTKEDGELVKPHYHFVLTNRNQKLYSAWRKELGLDDRWLMPCDSRDEAIKYLFHYGWPDKYQYPIEDGFGPLLGLAEKLCQEKMPESQQVVLLLKILDGLPRGCTYRQFLEAACKADLYSAFRRLGVGITRLLDERAAQDWMYSHRGD